MQEIAVIAMNVNLCMGIQWIHVDCNCNVIKYNWIQPNTSEYKRIQVSTSA